MPRREAELKARLLATFRVEATEHLEHLQAMLFALAEGRAAAERHALVETTFRVMHTLKGAARSVGLRDVERLCQESEAQLATLSRGRTLPTAEQLGELEAAVAKVAELLDEPRAAPPSRRAADRIRLTADDLDVLLRRAEDLLTVKLAAGAAAERAEALAAELRSGDPRAAQTAARALVSTLQRDRHAVALAVDGLLEQAQRVRMMPASTVLDVFPRMLRDLAGSQGKEVRWSATGTDLAVDRRVLEAIRDPLIHLVRNAVDHGAEEPQERVAAGKPRAARIRAGVRALEGGRIEVVVSDDGRGIDAERVRVAARRARVPAGDADSLELVFRSGLSTSFVITDVSGHGLGLSIVREQVERLGGTVELESRPGAGTTIRLVVPATVTTFRGLLVAAGGRTFLISLDAVERAVRAEPRPRDGGELLPCAPLAAVLGLPAGEPGTCVIVEAGGARAGLLVDEVLGEREGLVREFEPPLVRVRHVAAAGLLGGGELVLILRPADLVAAARGQLDPPAPVPEPAGPPAVLVVDDTVTTRAMERGLLELAGYRVEVAVDGVDAWTALQQAPFDLVVSDVDMPRMNGFELTTRIRSDRRLADLPVVLVSALEAREDKERGIAVGANAYVVKSSFEQSNLLEIIRRLGVVAA